MDQLKKLLEFGSFEELIDIFNKTVNKEAFVNDLYSIKDINLNNFNTLISKIEALDYIFQGDDPFISLLCAKFGVTVKFPRLITSLKNNKVVSKKRFEYYGVFDFETYSLLVSKGKARQFPFILSYKLGSINSLTHKVTTLLDTKVIDINRKNSMLFVITSK